MTEKVKYDNTILYLIRRLSDINTQLTIKKTEDNEYIEIQSKSPSGSILYEFKTPVEKFEFDGEDISFFDYKEFYSLLTVNEDSDIEQDSLSLEISKGRSKLCYYLAEKDALGHEEEDEYVAFDDVDASFKLSIDTLKKFKTLKGLTKAEELTLKVEGSKILLKLFYEQGQPTYEEEFDLTEPATEDFEIIVDADILPLLPENDYTIDLNTTGVVRFKYVNDNNIELNLYVSECEYE